MIALEKPIIFFDGVCGLCNTFVDLCLRLDKRRVFMFAPLQGSTAQKLGLIHQSSHINPKPTDDTNSSEDFNSKPTTQLNSVIVFHKSQKLEKSDAVLFILKLLGFPWSLFSIFSIIPTTWRDFIYDFVARNRYNWFGQKQSCRLPTAAERSQFLD